jgi:hypothetical protein
MFGFGQQFEIVPAFQNGLFLYRRLTGIPNEPNDQLEIQKLDTAFNSTWHGFLAVQKKYLLVGRKADADYLYLLFHYVDFTRNDLEMFALEQGTGRYVRHVIKNFIPFNPSEFQVTKEGVLLGGYFNKIPVVIFYSFDTQKSRLLPGLQSDIGELTHIKVHTDGSFDVLVSARNLQGTRTIWVKSYNAQADLMRNLPLEPEDNKNLLFARSLKTTNNMQVIAGVYGSRNSEYSKGIFMASIDPSGLQQIRYYNFGDLQNFFKYMKAGREKRVRERIARRRIRGKKIRFNYRFMVHELVPYKNQYVLLGEAFYPHYTSAGPGYSGFFMPNTMGRNSYVRDGRIFDGYNYTHAVVMGFDNDGNLQWDNSFEINDVKTYTLEQFVKLEPHADKIDLLYMFRNELRTKVIQGNEVLEGKASETIRTGRQNEITRMDESNTSRLDYWYGRYFYAYGVQDVFSPESGKRKVFFINKISSR